MSGDCAAGQNAKATDEEKCQQSSDMSTEGAEEMRLTAPYVMIYSIPSINDGCFGGLQS